MGPTLSQIFCHPSKNSLQIQNLHQELSKFSELELKQCGIYGIVHQFQHNSLALKVLLKQSSEQSQNKSYSLSLLSPQYLHYVLNENILVIPPHTLLEEYRLDLYQQEDKLLGLICDISQLCIAVDIGLGKNKLALAQYDIRKNLKSPVFVKQYPQNPKLIEKNGNRKSNSWKVVGFDYGNPFWNYQAIIQNPNQNSEIYLSPELMQAYSKDKIYPKIDVKKSDVFIMAIMLLQILFDEQLQSKVFNYEEYEIRLKPLLQKLSLIEEKFSTFTYNIFVRSLQFDPQERISFQEIINEVGNFKYRNNNSAKSPYVSGKEGYSGYKTVTPINSKPKTGSPFLKQCQQRDKQARNKGRSPGAIRKNLGSDRSYSISPYERRKNSIPLIRKTPAQFGYHEQIQNSAPKIDSFGLSNKFSGRISNQNIIQPNSRRKKVQNIRY